MGRGVNEEHLHLNGMFSSLQSNLPPYFSRNDLVMCRSRHERKSLWLQGASEILTHLVFVLFLFYIEPLRPVAPLM